MKTAKRWLLLAAGAVGIAPLVPHLAGAQQAPSKPAASAGPTLPPGEGKQELLKNCQGCHQINVITAQHQTESGWTDTVVQMRSRGANGTDEDMEKIIHYLTTNFGPQQPGAKTAQPAPPQP